VSYTASGSIARIRTKGYISTATALTDPQVLEWLNDALRSGIVPFLKAVRDEWFVTGSESVTPDANGRIEMPNSVASTVRTVVWMNNGQPTPLTRIEPEAAFAYEGQTGGSGIPVGFVLEGYGLRLLPSNLGSVTIRLKFMERPAEMVLDESAGLIESHASLALTLADVPLAWQADTPAAVDLISSESPFSAVATDVTVVSLVGSVLTLSGISASLVEDGFWVSDPGTSPYPNIPIELHPLLQRMCITDFYGDTGDKRYDTSEKRLEAMKRDLRKTMAPRTQGNARPIINPSAPGMRNGRNWWGC
jgi:hypothetical protein